MNENLEIETLSFADYHDFHFLIFLEFLTNLKFDNNYHWRTSLRTKINAFALLSEEVKSQYDKAIKAKEEMEIKGFGSGLESELLLIKFETTLNSVYSLCDNLAFISYKLHPGIARSFNEQRKKVENYRIVYSQYSEYLDLVENANWYEKLHTMRTESTHYLPGFVYHSKSGLGILYREMEHSDERIEIENIRDYLDALISEVNTFLEKYGTYHLKNFIDDSCKTFHPCLIPDSEGKGFLAGGREITLSDYKNKNPGICVFPNVPCPHKETCPAYKKK